LVLILIVASAAAGRSVFGALGSLGGGGVTSQALAQARTHIQASAWTQAILQLNRIDLASLKDGAQLRETLFLLGYAHFQANHPAEANDYLKELASRFPQDKEGLYLAGYINLEKDQLDAAEAAFRSVYKLDSAFNPGVSVRYYLSLVLYRKAMGVLEKDLEQGAALLSEVSTVGGLDKQVADALIRVHLFRCIQAVRAHDWQTAGSEANLAQQKLNSLGELVSDPKELAKLRGLVMAASGLVAFKQENFAEARKSFTAAATEVKSLSKKLDFKKGGSFLEQLLQAYLEKSAEQGGVHPNFSRDLHFLAGVATLRTGMDNIGTLSKADAKKLLKGAADSMQESISAAPQFVEGRAVLGLIWYYLGEDKETREKGMEMLQSVRERVSSKFLNQTVSDYEGEKQRSTDARKAYFDLLQQYLQFSNVPLSQRQQMRDRMRAMLEENGELESFVGRGSLEIEREEEPTVQEYMNRTALLREKINALIEANRGQEISPNLSKLIEQLNAHNSELQNAVKTIADLEHQILSEAQRLL
jgi:tetratricopeptide (TPR) repeat protein